MQQIENIYSLEERMSISGRVIHGRQTGRELGFPTANVNAYAGHLENGVYGVFVSLKGNQYWGIMNIGVKPTFGLTLKKTIVVHLLDFYNEIYGEPIECQLLFKVREERKFSSTEFLKRQIKEDIHYANQRFNLLGDSFKTKKRVFRRKERTS